MSAPLRDDEWLRATLIEAGAASGTVHRRQGEELALTGAVGIPAPVVAATREIPRGKGMAGLAWLRATPVSTCNLPQDTSGDVRPGAKAVNAGAAAAVPVLGPDGAVRAVVGFAFVETIELSDAALERLSRQAARLPRTE